MMPIGPSVRGHVQYHLDIQGCLIKMFRGNIQLPVQLSDRRRLGRQSVSQSPNLSGPDSNTSIH